MTDELYMCSDCGMEDVGTYNRYKIGGINKHLTEDELDAIAEAIGWETSELEAEEIPYCSNCDNEYEGRFISSSEIEYDDDDDN